MAVNTLSDLVFHLRDVSAGRPDLLTVDLPRGRETLSTADFLKNVHSLALALEAQGVEPGDRVAIFAENRPEWHTVDFACQLLGVATVPLYPTLAGPQVGYVLRNSGTRLVFYSDARKRDLLVELRSALTGPLQVVAFDADATVPGGMSITRLMGQGAERRGEVPIERFRGRVSEDDLASIIYTSGTTGDPKGVMLSHRNLVSNFLACAELFALGPRDLGLSFLPLSHVFQRTLDHVCFYRGVRIHYVPAVERVPSALRRVRPTVFAAVPRFFERIYVGVWSQLRKEGAVRRATFGWALEVGRRYAQAREESFVGPFLAFQRQLAERLVHRRIRARFGGRLRMAISGGAPLAREVSEFFAAIGMPVYQGYGLTESAPVLATNAPGRHRQGSVGRTLPGVELTLADDGEVLARGPGIMQGYWKNPQATAEAIDADGWLHTGDVGRIDGSGYLFITDRKKDLLVTSGGKNIAPQPIENLLTSYGLIAQAVVVGDGYPYATALLVPDWRQLASEVEDLPPEELVAHPGTREKLDAVVAEVNRKLTEHERLRRWKLLERELTIEAGELTPTLKIRRKAIAQRYADDIASLYPKSQKRDG